MSRRTGNNYSGPRWAFGSRPQRAAAVPPATCSECGTRLIVSATWGTVGMPVWDAADGSECTSGIGHIPQDEQ